ncbi:hypothetical protein D3C81_1666720 [compost metagenome]
MPAFIIKPMTLDSVTISLRNSDSGSTGLLALISTRMKISRKTAAVTNRPIVWVEPHAYLVPAQEKPSSSGTMVRVRNSEPR